ncbi:MAG: hypothetical protein MJ186_04330, partial [Clostridia bacterium]|nr:hypothetical protein [Clostridia bacterium]
MNKKIISIILAAAVASAALTGCDWSAYIDSSGESLPVESLEDPKPSAPQEEQDKEAEPSA